MHRLFSRSTHRPSFFPATERQGPSGCDLFFSHDGASARWVECSPRLVAGLSIRGTRGQRVWIVAHERHRYVVRIALAFEPGRSTRFGARQTYVLVIPCAVGIELGVPHSLGDRCLRTVGPILKDALLPLIASVWVAVDASVAELLLPRANVQGRPLRRRFGSHHSRGRSADRAGRWRISSGWRARPRHDAMRWNIAPEHHHDGALAPLPGALRCPGNMCRYFFLEKKENIACRDGGASRGV